MKIQTTTAMNYELTQNEIDAFETRLFNKGFDLAAANKRWDDSDNYETYLETRLIFVEWPAIEETDRIAMVNGILKSMGFGHQVTSSWNDNNDCWIVIIQPIQTAAK